MTSDKERADKEKAAIDNRNQDPSHPANKTLSPGPRTGAETYNVPAADRMTEQEKDTSSELPGVGPVSASEVSPGPVETIEDQGIGPRTPYPEGNPPPVHEEVTRSQGINRGRDDRAVPKPDKPVTKEHK